MARKIPYRNKSPYGWWVASYLVRLEYDDENKENPNRKCLAWENTIILHSPNREAAYREAVRIGSLGDGSRAREVESGRERCWRFEGLTSLLPVYERLEHGAEILWKEHRNRTVRKIKSWVKQKKQLETFDDTPPS
jgi:hypothetical protein